MTNLLNDQRAELINTLTDIRTTIRIHRDQRGDYRCWVDDEVVYHKLLPELKGKTAQVPDPETFASFCLSYYHKRQDFSEPQDTLVPLDSSVGAMLIEYDHAKLNADLVNMSLDAVSAEIQHWYELLREHKARGYLNKTLADDLKLYLYLPEKKLPVTKLPPQEQFVNSNCPKYNKHCQEHPEDFTKAAWNVS